MILLFLINLHHNDGSSLLGGASKYSQSNTPAILEYSLCNILTVCKASLNERPWYQIINEYSISQYGLNEKEYYKKIFNKYYSGYEKIIPYEWLPKWSNESNPSGRLIL